MPYTRRARTVQGDPADVLHQAGEAQQWELVKQLAASGPASLAVLVDAFAESRTGRLRCYILDALPASDDRRVAGLIEAGLRDGGSSVRCHAIEALVLRKEPDACRLLLPLLRDSNAAVRCGAMAASATLACRSERTIAELLDGTRDPDWRFRQAAARALGALGIRQSANELRGLAADPRNAVRVAAAEALALLEGR
jgi:HEAT repeat protein